MKTATLILSIICTLSINTLFAQTAPQATKIKKPVWSSGKIGTIYFKDDTSNLKNRYEITRIKNLSHSTRFDGNDIYKILKSFNTQTEDQEKELITQAFALALVQNILQHEVELSPLYIGVSDQRVDYVLRSILSYAATATNHIKTKKVPVYDSLGNQKKNSKGELVFSTIADEDTTKLDLSTMYGWFKKDLIGSNYISKLNVKWDYKDGGLDKALAMLNATEPFLWKNITFFDLDLPETIDQFRAKLKEMLQQAYEQNKTKWIFSTLKNKYVNPKTLAAISSDMKIPSITKAKRILNEMKTRKMVKPETEISDKGTLTAITNLMFNNAENYITRELIFNLLKQNTYIEDFEICKMDDKWSCVQTDATSLANSLFPEIRYDNRQDKTSLNHYTDFSTNTLQISGDFISFLLSL